MRIRTANAAAGMILNIDLESHVGESLVELAESRPLLAQFLTVAAGKLAEGKSEWREQIVLRGDVGPGDAVRFSYDKDADKVRWDKRQVPSAGAGAEPSDAGRATNP